MKYVINAAFGGFEIPEEVLNNLKLTTINNFDAFGDLPDVRTNPVLIDWVERHPNSELAIVNIPDEATDYMVSVDDGFEEVYAVIDGRIKFISPEGEDA